MKQRKLKQWGLKLGKVVNGWVASQCASGDAPFLLAGVVAGALAVYVYTCRASGTCFAPKALASSDPFHLAELISNRTAPEPQSSETLVLYWYHSDDPMGAHNLRYYLQHGLNSSEDTTHWVFVPEGSPKPIWPLPPRFLYLTQTAGCGALGTVGSLIKRGLLHPKSYSHYVFLSSDMRGPFLPTFALGWYSWLDLLRGMLSDDVRMVGSAISCTAAEHPEHPRRHNPHVEFTGVVMLASDALAVLEEEGEPLQCYRVAAEQRYFSVVGASAVLLSKGLNIASLHARYQGVDWRKQRYWDCNGGHSMYRSARYDFVGLHPYTMMFVPLTSRRLSSREWGAVQATQITHWNPCEDPRERGVPGWTEDEVAQGRIPRVLKTAVTMPWACFNGTKYGELHQDLAAFPDVDKWLHYINSGQFEEREAGLMCSIQEKELLPFIPNPINSEFIPNPNADVLTRAFDQDGTSVK